MSEHPISLHRTAADPSAAVPATPHTPATHFSREKQARFVDILAVWGNVRDACRQAHVAPQTVYRHRRNSRDFALAWDAALLVARPQVEEVLGDRALNGIEEVVYYHGEEIARRRRYDSRLLLAHLGRLDRIDGREEVVEVSEDFDAALERLRRGRPVDPSRANEPDPDDPHPWEDETLPFVERALLYQEWLAAGSEEGADDDDADPFAPDYDEDDDEYSDEQGSDEEMLAGDYLLQDSVTPVTLPADSPPPAPPEPTHPAATSSPCGEASLAPRDPSPRRRGAAGGAGGGHPSEPPPEPAPEPEPESETPYLRRWQPWDQSDAPRLFGTHGPINDGRLQRLL